MLIYPPPACLAPHMVKSHRSYNLLRLRRPGGFVFHMGGEPPVSGIMGVGGGRVCGRFNEESQLFRYCIPPLMVHSNTISIEQRIPSISSQCILCRNPTHIYSVLLSVRFACFYSLSDPTPICKHASTLAVGAETSG